MHRIVICFTIWLVVFSWYSAFGEVYILSHMDISKLVYTVS
jgi:hypothetical protein